MERKANGGPVWCVVANVAEERRYGPGGVASRRGTRHFTPGTKVYCFPVLWGDGYDKILVVGRHRGSHRYVTMVVRSRWLTNWRIQLVYSPHIAGEMERAVLERLPGYSANDLRRSGSIWDGTPEAKARAEDLVAAMRESQTSLVGSHDSEGTP